MANDKGDLDIRSLKYFISVAECLSFTKAADKCYISQAAMSMHIANIEKNLGFKLFLRDSRKVVLTPAGRELYRNVKEIVKMYDSAIVYSSGIANGVEGTIIVLLTSYIDALYFMKHFQNFQDNNPNIILTVRVVEPREIVDMLEQKEGDIAFCWPHDFEAREEYAVKIVDKSSVCIAFSPKHMLAQKYKTVKIEDIKNERIIVIGEGSLPNSYRVISSNVLKMGINSFSIIKVHKLEEILIYLEMNYGVAILPQYIENLVPSNRIEFRGIENVVPITFDLAAIYLKRNSSTALLKFLETFPEI